MRTFFFILWVVLTMSCSGYTRPESIESTPEAIYAHDDFSESFKLLAKQLGDIDSGKNGQILEVAQLFLDSVYVSKTLEIGCDSAPVINIRQLDCLTFIENAVALEKSHGNPDSFIHWISEIRYINGQPSGYTSRLHYFSEWILDNVKKGWVEDVTCSLGGETIQFNNDFMSKHPQYYPQLQQDSSLIQEIKTIESEVSKAQFCYIPKQRLIQIESNIMDGDILGLTTNIKGLDFAHNGFAVRKNNRVYMLHASSDFKRVMITMQPLSEYLKDMQHMTGIVVLRLTSVEYIH